MSVTINGTNGLVFPDASTQNTAATGFGFKNRIINGAMMIDQRNAGASVTPNQSDGSVRYLVDRFGYSATQASKITWQQSTTVPATGFKNSLSAVVASAVASPAAGDQFVLTQSIEGLNVADLGFGTAGASPVTISFWVRSSVTGTYSVSLQNNAFNRAYIATYSIASANTWTQVSLTIAGDTSGTWTTDTTAGLRINWDLGSGSNDNGTAGAWASSYGTRTSGSVNWISNTGATFYITGVQLEKGSTATSFDYRPYGTELALCQRYYYKTNVASGGGRYASGYAGSGTTAYIAVPFPCAMRTNPTALEQSGTASNYALNYSGAGALCSSVPTFIESSIYSAVSLFTVSSGLTAGWGLMGNLSSSGYLAWSAEL